MRNLEATSHVALPPSPLLAGAACFCLDADAVCVWVVASAGLCRVSSDYQISLEVPFVDGGHVTADDHVIGVEHVSDLESVCLATWNGDILLYNTHTGHVECVGSVDGGLLGMAWSPDQELVVFSTRTGTLLLMTHQLDLSGDAGGHELIPVTETPISPADIGEAKPVTVGWGQKSTQFHGSAGKQSAKETPVGDIGPTLPWDDLRPRVSWRGDGEYFVCSCVEPVTGGRRLRVWTREGVLHSTSEETTNLEHSLHWKPSGSLIASSQCLPHTHQVVFFERNGLRHGEFSLPPNQPSCQVCELQWNCDSSVLCVWVKERQTDAAVSKDSSAKPSPTSIQLWTTSNYHWYLKQELCSLSTTNSTHSIHPVAIQWDPIVPLKLHILTTDGCYICYNWRWNVNKSSCLSPDNLCDIVVIDGNRLLLTPLRHTVTPPPMSTHTLILPSPAFLITHAPPPHSNDFLVKMTNEEITIFSYDNKKDSAKERLTLQPPRTVGTTRFPTTACPIRQLCWRQPDKLVGVVWDPVGLRDTVVEFTLTVDREEGRVEIVTCHSTAVPPPHSSLLSLTSSPHTATTIAQTTNGTILRFSTGEGLFPWPLSSSTPLQFPDQSCDHITLANFQEKEHVVGLNAFRHCLYVDDCKVATGVTTFDLHNDFILYTTDSHTCRFVPVDSDPFGEWNVDTPNPLDEGLRRVERGSRIVAVVPHDFKLVLQMPRGNLETIFPRVLVLSSVRRHLDQLRYGDAFIIMRKHRINLNLIYDHNPELFLAHTKEFVEQLSSVAHINLFLTELSEEDTALTMYPGLVKRNGCRSEGRGDASRGEKVDLVCEAVRKSLLELGENRYLLSIITAHVKKSEPELETVLLKIKHLQDSSVRGEGGEAVRGGGGEAVRGGGGEAVRGGGGEHVTAEAALKYALFLVNVDRLYEVALGMYDFQLVLMVAEKSQKDPKEYLPFLNGLRSLPPSYQKYRIDHYLHRYHKALQHISQCGPEKFDECLSLIKEHSLYVDALEIFTDRSSQEYRVIAQSYGKFLEERGSHREAASIFLQCGCLSEALESFQKAGNWRMTFALCAQLGYSSGETMQLARTMANSLCGQRDYSAAASVLLSYAKDVEAAMVMLLEGSLWEEAIRVAYLHGRQDLLETHLKPQILESHQQHLSLLPTLTSTLFRHTERLQLVRETKRRKQEAILEGSCPADERDGDLFSDTSSITGRSVTASLTSSVATSRKSGKSVKTRRKASHKKWSLREGSSHEDLALIEAISDLCGTVDRLQDEVPSLLEVLLQYGHTHEARQLHSQFTDLMESARASIQGVWPDKTTPTNNQCPSSTGPHATVNSMLASLPHLQAAQQLAAEDVFPKPKLRDIHWQLHLFS